KFFDETGAFKFLVQTEAGEGFHAERQERFADVKAREFLPLENDDAPAGLGEQSRGRAARRAAANYRDIEDFVQHAASNLAKMSQFALGENAPFLLRFADAFP